MKVIDLIQELAKHPDDLEVMVYYDSTWAPISGGKWQCERPVDNCTCVREATVVELGDPEQIQIKALLLCKGGMHEELTE